MTDQVRVNGTELARRLGEYLKLAEHGTTVIIIDGQHPDWVRAVLAPPPANGRRSAG